MNLTQLAMNRHTTKVFDPSKKLTPEMIKDIEGLLRFCPSSTNIQPWHFVLASTEEGKAKVAEATTGFYSFNQPKIQNASLVVVFCTKTNVDDAYLQAVLAQEDKDGRFSNPAAKEGQHQGRSYFVDMHRYEQRDVQHWMDKQVYLAIGALLIGASALGIDACPMEGFDDRKLNEVLDLRKKGYTSAAIVSLGYRGEKDFNATLPKSRFPADSVITRI